MAAEMTQEELDRLAAEEAEALLAKHQTRVPLTAEQILAEEREKATLLSRVGMNADPDNGPRARRLVSRDQGGPEAPPPGETLADPAVRRPAAIRAVESLVPVPQEILAPRGDVDLERVDPIQLAELAEDAKAWKKRYVALQAELDSVRASYEAAQARFMAYLQQ